MSKNPSGFCGKIIIASILVIISGCFFYSRIDSIFGANFAQGKELKNSVWEEEEYLSVLSGEKNFLGSEYNFSSGDEEKIDPEKKALENQLREIAAGYPIEEMIPYISEYDRKIAGLIVGIAKKESDWGKHAPSKDGKTCYNYWGYKGGGSLGHSLGYGCFASPEEGVNAIGGRIQELVNKKLNTPSKMIVWKCGSTCAGHDPAGVKKWISDVSIYFDKISKKG
ncbi:MAG: Uncharacterized protein Athens071425_606 [Parcubacteria group bacterium Athens0714_25]|nr:MAG: Uncharacterized protein Athens071425_606 [Parcubacteria group bacterium Athens0714_25]